MFNALNENKDVFMEFFFRNKNLDEEKKEYLISTAIVVLVSAATFGFNNKKENIIAEKIYNNMKESCELLIKFI